VPNIKECYYQIVEDICAMAVTKNILERIYCRPSWVYL